MKGWYYTANMGIKMSNYYHLPIYKEAYGLLLDIFRRVDKLAKGYRYTIGERLKNECLDILKHIYLASDVGQAMPKERSAYIALILQSVTHMKVLLRVLKDLGEMSVKNYTVFSQKVESLSKQATGWYNASVS